MGRSDVLIVGAGPTGPVLALWLMKLGVSVRILDRAADPGTTSRSGPEGYSVAYSNSAGLSPPCRKAGSEDETMTSMTIAAALVQARAEIAGLSAFPGAVPTDLDSAYAIQAAAIGLWSDAIGGWKVGRITGALQEALGVDRFLGPVFASTIQRMEPGAPVPFPVYPGGFAALEAEFVLEIGRDVPADRRDWRAEDARAYVGAVHIGVEVAGSPLAPINELGALVTIAAFGNNAGLIVGPEVADWRDGAFENEACAASIDGASVGAATAAQMPGGPFAALAFAFAQAARLGRTLRAGTLISTGAVTGVHPIGAGQTCRADFGRYGRIDCVTVSRS